MKKITRAGLVIALIMSPLTSSAALTTNFDLTYPRCIDIKSDIKLGSRDMNGKQNVWSLQQVLNDKNNLDGQDINPKGYFNKAGVAALKKFQLANGFKATGIAGPMTRKFIKEQTCSLGASTTTPGITTSMVNEHIDVKQSKLKVSYSAPTYYDDADLHVFANHLLVMCPKVPNIENVAMSDADFKLMSDLINKDLMVRIGSKEDMRALGTKPDITKTMNGARARCDEIASLKVDPRLENVRKQLVAVLKTGSQEKIIPFLLPQQLNTSDKVTPKDPITLAKETEENTATANDLDIAKLTKIENSGTASFATYVGLKSQYIFVKSGDTWYLSLYNN